MILLPGKILVVDNSPDDVKNVLRSFRNKGVGVVYSQSAPSQEKVPANVRLVIVDLDLDGCGHVTDEDLEQVVLVLQRVESKTKLYLVALWSQYASTSDWIQKVRETYRNQTLRELPPYSLKLFNKISLRQRNLVIEIRKWINENSHAGLIIQWENTIENSRDSVMSDVMNVGGIDTIVRSINQELGTEAVPRALSFLLNRVLLRHASTKHQISLMKKRVNSILSSGAGSAGYSNSEFDWYAKLYYLQAYYSVNNKEPLWTGDILKYENTPVEGRQYAIVITPACDLAQKKVKDVKVVFGTEYSKISSYNVTDSNIPDIVKCFGKTPEGKFKKRDDILDMLAGKKKAPARLFRLYFMKSSSDAPDFFHLLFDFSLVNLLPCNHDVNGNPKVPRNYKRLCRVDSPYIEDLVQQYAAFSSRHGTPSIPDAIEKELEKRLKG